MSIYTVMVPAGAPAQEETARAVFVADAFNRAAFVFAPLWCIYRRSWLGLVLWCAGAAAVRFGAPLLGLPFLGSYAAVLILQFLFGLEAAQLHRRSLLRRGYVLADVVSADTRDEARLTFELRRAAIQSQAAPVPVPVSVTAMAPTRPRPLNPGDGFGLAPLGGGA